MPLAAAPRAASLVGAIALAALSLSGPPPSGSPAAPRAALPSPRLGDLPGRIARPASIAEQNAACEACHPDIAAEWRASHHRRAFTDPAFQRALALERDDPFCRGCHAPEAPTSASPPPELAALGVACTTCHLAGDTVLAAPRPDPRPAPREGARPAPHPVARLAGFAAEGACAACHEFDFPDSPRRAAPEKMQLTVTEHAASPYAEMTCAGCHMPFTGAGPGRHRSHAFAASRFPAAQARALSVEVSRRGADVEVALAAGEVGHAFPTGDLFRRLAVTAEAVGADGSLAASVTRYLARHYRAERLPDGGRARVTIEDDRPGAPALEGRRIVVPFSLGPAAEGRVVVVRVTYERVLQVPDGPEERAEVESAAVLFERALPPEPRGEGWKG